MKQASKFMTSLAASGVRLAALILAALAAGEALATDSLEETGGVLSTVATDTLAFKGVTLSELTADTLHGRMAGGWAGTAATKSFTFNNFDRSNEGSGYITCQAQLVDDEWLKGMVLKFTQSGDDINAQIVSAGSINGGSVGDSVAGKTNANGNYSIYNLFLTRSWSDSAVVIWEAGQFGVTSKTGSDGNTYTLNLNSNSNGSGEAITINQSLGATIDFSSAFAADDGGTVLIRYSNLPLDTTQRAIVTTKCGSNNDRTGVWINTDATAGKTGGVWNGGNHNSSGNTRTTLDSNKSAGVMAFTYHHTGGSYLYYLANGVKTIQHRDTGLKGNNDTISGIAIGGTRATYTTGTAATDMKITGIAIFKGVLTESQMNSFVWPSAVAAGYAKWNYAAAGRVVTWKSLPDSSLDSGTGQKITVAGTTYGVFDTYSGSDTGTYTGGATSNSGAHWHYFCFGKSVYSAPGSVMRFVASNTYAHNIRADYSPLTIGGIIVESGATGYTIAEDASNGRKDNRAVILGDQPASGRETWFRFNEDFTFGRQGALAFVGSVNIEVAAGKTMTITAKANNSSETFVPKVCSSVAVNSDGSGALSTLTAGGTLRLHGLGKIASTAGLDASSATLDYADLPATSSTSAGAFIQGTLTVNSSTIIALPADATFPYYIATGISGSLNSMTGVTIGGAEASYYQANAAGYIEYVAPPEVTISSDATWGSGDFTGWATDDATKDYIINVTADATLTLPSAVSSKTIKFNVDDGVTLTVSGSTLTAADEIEVTGAGIVKVTANNALSGTVRGDGTILYQYSSQEADAVPTATFTDSGWTGTLWIKDFGNESYHSNAGGTRVMASLGTMVSFGNSGSRVKFTNVKAYYQSGTVSCPWTLVLEDGDNAGEYAWKNDSGWTSGSVMTIAAIEGNGTLYDGYNTCTPPLYFTNAAAFTGTIYNNGKRIAIGSGATPSSTAGTITIGANASATIASGKTWTAGGGIVVAASGSLTVAGTVASAITDNGTLTLGDAAIVSGAISGSGEVVCTVLPDNAGLADSSGWTGTVTVKSETYNPFSGFTEHTSTRFMNANSRLHAVLGDGVVMGFVQLMSASGLTGPVDIDQNVTLYINDTTSSSISFIAGNVNGSVSMDSCTATTLNLTLGSARPYITYSTTLTTLNISATETLADDGVYTQTVTGLSSLTTTTMTLTKLDGTVENLTGTVEGSTLTFSWTPTVSGAACWVAYEMEYESGNANKTGFENSGSESPATALASDTISGTSTRLEGVDAFTEDGMLYTYAHPWRNMTGDNAYPSSWTAVVRCTVPAYENAAVITFGTKSDGLIGLVAGADPETQMKLVKTTGNSAFTTLATMNVANATTAQHVYVFSVENNQTIKVYCDGEQVLNETYSTFTLGGGIQVGSVHGGIDATGIVRFGKGESPANTLSETVQKAARIDCVRLYKTALGPNAIAQLSVEFPAVKLYRATVAANVTTTWDALTWSPTWDGGNEYSKIILTTEGDATLTLPDSITADEFIVDIAEGSTLMLAKASGGSAMTVSKLEINDGKVAVADADFFGNRVINGTGTLKITATDALTSALSGNAKFEIPSGVGVGVLGGSIANAITGAGELVYQNLADVPASLTFSAWTGTVSLPIFNASSGVNFNNYGTTGSTVALAGMTGGYILEDGKTVNPTLRLDGAMNITAMSSWEYTFAEITGTGSLSFTTSANTPIAVTIANVAEGYSGTITSTLATPVTINTLKRASGVSRAGGTNLLSLGGDGEFSVEAVTIGGTVVTPIEVKDDGVYIGYGTTFTVY